MRQSMSQHLAPRTSKQIGLQVRFWPKADIDEGRRRGLYWLPTLSRRASEAQPLANDPNHLILPDKIAFCSPIGSRPRMGTPATDQPSDAGRTGKLFVENVAHAYENGVKALTGVTLRLGVGMFGLLGPNGAGKSTLMRTISTLQATVLRAGYV